LQWGGGKLLNAFDHALALTTPKAPFLRARHFWISCYRINYKVK
jgi:hypothetical protein